MPAPSTASTPKTRPRFSIARPRSSPLAPPEPSRNYRSNFRLQFDHADIDIAGTTPKLDSKRRNRMNQLTTKFDATTGESNGTRLPAPRNLMDRLSGGLGRLGLLSQNLDYHLI